MTIEEAIEKLANETYPPLHPAWSGTENEAFKHGAEVGYNLHKAAIQPMIDNILLLKEALRQMQLRLFVVGIDKTIEEYEKRIK